MMPGLSVALPWNDARGTEAKFILPRTCLLYFYTNAKNMGHIHASLELINAHDKELTKKGIMDKDDIITSLKTIPGTYPVT